MQDELGQLARLWSRVNRTLIAILHDLGDAADVVEMGMRYEKRLDSREIVREFLSVLFLSHAFALDHAAVN